MHFMNYGGCKNQMGILTFYALLSVCLFAKRQLQFRHFWK